MQNTGCERAQIFEGIEEASLAGCVRSRRLDLGGHRFDSNKLRLMSLWMVVCDSYTGYIGEFEHVDDHRSGKIVVNLIGRINKCGVISPRFDVALKEIESWVTNLLPSRQFGYIILTTSAGIIDHEEARRLRVGGKILAFCY